MKRIAENIAKAVLNTFKGNQDSVSNGVRYYYSNPRNRAEVPATNRKEDINARGEHTLDRAYASGTTNAEIQYC